MQQLEKIKNMKLSTLTPAKQLTVFKLTFIGTVFLLIILNLASLGITGTNFMIWTDLQTSSMQKIMSQHHSTYFSSQQFILAFDVLCLIMLLVLTYSVFKFYTKGNLIIIVLTTLFWIVRWIACIFFLSTDQPLKDENQKKLTLMYDTTGKMSPLCMAEECTGELLNYVQCGKILIWKRLEHFQTGYLIITIILGVVLFYTAYKTNQLDISLVQNEDQLNETS